MKWTMILEGTEYQTRSADNGRAFIHVKASEDSRVS